MQSCDRALGRVVEQHRTDADAHVELEPVGVGKEGLVLTNRLSLVVEHRPAAPHPARSVVRRHHRLAIRAHDDLAVAIPHRHRPRLGPDLLLDLATEAVRIGEGDLYLGVGDLDCRRSVFRALSWLRRLPPISRNHSDLLCGCAEIGPDRKPRASSLLRSGHQLAPLDLHRTDRVHPARGPFVMQRQSSPLLRGGPPVFPLRRSPQPSQRD